MTNQRVSDDQSEGIRWPIRGHIATSDWYHHPCHSSSRWENESSPHSDIITQSRVSIGISKLILIQLTSYCIRVSSDIPLLSLTLRAESVEAQSSESEHELSCKWCILQHFAAFCMCEKLLAISLLKISCCPLCARCLGSVSLSRFVQSEPFLSQDWPIGSENLHNSCFFGNVTDCV